MCTTVVMQMLQMKVCENSFSFFILQEGLILGESKFEEQVTISDSQADHIQIDEIYSELELITPSVTQWQNDKLYLLFYRYPTASPFLQTEQVSSILGI